MFDENNYTVVGLSDEELHTAFLSREYKPFSDQDIIFKEYYDRDGMRTILGKILFGRSYDSEDIYNFLNKLSPSFAEKYKMSLNYVEPVEQKLNYKCKVGTVDDSNKCFDDENTTSSNFKYKMIDNIEGGNDNSKNRDVVLKSVENILSKSNCDPLENVKFIDIDGGEIGESSSGLYLGIESRMLDDDYAMQKIEFLNRSEDEFGKFDYGKLNNGENRRFSVAAYAKTPDELRSIIVIHELAHYQMMTYRWSKGSISDPVRASNGDDEWQDIISKESENGWKHPTVYSNMNFSEMFAECFTLNEIGRSDLLTEKIVDYIEGVKNAKKSYR